MAIGVNQVEYSPTSTTGWYAGISPPVSGYTVYVNKVTQGPSILVASNDNDLVSIAISQGATSTVTTAAGALNYFASQSDMMVVNKNYNNIVTSGLVLNLDASFVASYPVSGTSWYDISGSGFTGTLTNGPTFNTGGWIVFDGTDDQTALSNITQNSNSSTTIEVLMKNNSDILTPSTAQMLFITNGSTTGSVDAYEQYTMSTAGSIPFIILKSRMQYSVSRTQYSYQVYYQILNNGMNNYPVVAQSWYNPNGSLASSEIAYPQIINQTYHYVWSITNSDLGTRSIKHYLNGQQIIPLGGAQTADFNFFNKNNLALGLRSNSNISTLRLYNKPLSITEITQNYYGGPIVTSGLTLAFDAGNLVSFQNGSGSTFSLVGSYTGTLQNGVSYTTGNGGGWVFDGSDDYVNIPYVGNTSNSFTFIIVMKCNNMTSDTALNRQTLFGLSQNGNGAFRQFDVEIWGNTGMGFRGNGSAGEGVNFFGYGWTLGVNANNINIYTITLNSTGHSIYVNGVLRNNISQTATADFNSIVLGTRLVGNLWNGICYSFSMYNRVLSTAEVAQNYNAQKRRFGF